MEDFINEILDELLPVLSNDPHSGSAKSIAQAILHDKISQLIMPMLEDFIDKYGLECPNSSNCNNGGTLSEHGCNGTEEDCLLKCPVPVQCEFCYCEPKSKFNLRNDLAKCLKDK